MVKRCFGEEASESWFLRERMERERFMLENIVRLGVQQDMRNWGRMFDSKIGESPKLGRH
jgi:hypothetical protein